MRLGRFAVWNLFAAGLWNLGASLASYGVASAASDQTALRSIVPIVIGIAALVVIILIVRKTWSRRHRHAEPAS
jgi:membrane protein DedA with SNARE-associated domain